MVSFLKRRKSTVNAERAQPSKPAPAVPAVPPQQARSMKSELSMPDLRFSRLDLDADVQSAVPGSSSQFLMPQQAGARPKSRLFSFGSRSTEDLQRPRQPPPVNPQNAPYSSASSYQRPVEAYATLPRGGQGMLPPKAPTAQAPLVPSRSSARRSAAHAPPPPGPLPMVPNGGPMMTSTPGYAPRALPIAPSNPSPTKPEMRRALNSATNVHVSSADAHRRSMSASSSASKPASYTSGKWAPMPDPSMSSSPKQPRRQPSAGPPPARKSAEHTSSRAAPPKAPVASTTMMTTSSSSSEGTDSSARTSGGDGSDAGSSNSSSFVTSDELSNMRTSPIYPSARARPARNEEHQERVQSRLSLVLDKEVGQALGQAANAERSNRTSYTSAQSVSPRNQAPQLPQLPTMISSSPIGPSSGKYDHKRTESSASKLSSFSAMLMASRPGGAADRSMEQEVKAAAEKAAAAAAAEEEQRQRREQYYRHGAMPTKLPVAENSMLARSGLFGTATSSSNVDEHDATIRRQRETSAKQQQQQQQEHVLSTVVKRVRESMPTVLTRTRTVQKSLQCRGDGWECLGLGDEKPVDLHWRTVIETVKVAHYKQSEETSDEETDDEKSQKEVEIEYRDEEFESHYNDLFELLFTSTTPDVIARLLSHLEMSDIKTLRQTSSAVRLAVGAQRESLLNNYLGPIGYKTWSQLRGTTTAYRARMAGQLPNSANKDPCPLTLQDLEAFMIGQDLLPEYAVVGQEYARDPKAMDPAMAGMARATTRAHNRVLTRLRLQPVYKPPSATIISSTKKSSPAPGASPSRSPLPSPQPGGGTITRHNSYYDTRKMTVDFSAHNLPPLPPIPASHSGLSSPASPLASPLPQTSSSQSLHDHQSTPPTPTENVATSKLVSPWKPGRAAYFRVWVPASDQNGWLSDEELVLCERELYKSGIWPHLKRGDIVWDTAVGDQLNEGKYVFDGHYLRDLSYAYDVAGHLPSWLNVVLYAPSYWHNIIRSSMPQPVVFLDITPWRDQILESLRLIQDQVDTFSGNGSRYRIAKWLYRAAANINHGQIVSRMNGGLEIVDEAWHGRIVIETDGTAESAKLLVNRCAGPDASPQEKAALLAQVMGSDAATAGKAINVNDTNGMAALGRPMQYNKFAHSKSPSSMGQHRGEPRTSAWSIMRERSRPGMIWLKPLGEREKVAAA